MAYTKDGIVRIFHSVHQKEKPPRSCDLPGGFFAPSGMRKPLPLGEVALRSNDGEGKPGTKEHLHSDKHWLLIESSYRCVFILSQHPCPLRRSRASSPRGRALEVRESVISITKKAPGTMRNVPGALQYGEGRGHAEAPPPGLVSLSPVRCGLPPPAAGWALRPHGG